MWWLQQQNRKEQYVKNKDFQERKPTDNTTNQHGRSLLNFLSDNDLCILNGRVTLSQDNFTSTGRGKAVVDYQITSTDSIGEFSEVSVSTVSELLLDLKIEMLSETTKLPDHSLLICKLDLLYKDPLPISQKGEIISWDDNKITKFKQRNLNSTIMDKDDLKIKPKSPSQNQ